MLVALLFILAGGLLFARNMGFITEEYLETHLPTEQFVRIHRSSIVNVTQISRLELFGKETYQLILKEWCEATRELVRLPIIEAKAGDIRRDGSDCNATLFTKPDGSDT